MGGKASKDAKCAEMISAGDHKDPKVLENHALPLVQYALKTGDHKALAAIFENVNLEDEVKLSNRKLLQNKRNQFMSDLQGVVDDLINDDKAVEASTLISAIVDSKLKQVLCRYMVLVNQYSYLDRNFATMCLEKIVAANPNGPGKLFCKKNCEKKPKVICSKCIHYGFTRWLGDLPDTFENFYLKVYFAKNSAALDEIVKDKQNCGYITKMNEEQAAMFWSKVGHKTYVRIQLNEGGHYDVLKTTKYPIPEEHVIIPHDYLAAAKFCDECVEPLSRGPVHFDENFSVEGVTRLKKLSSQAKAYLYTDFGIKPNRKISKVILKQLFKDSVFMSTTTMLHAAVKKNDIALFTALVDAGIGLNIRDAHGKQAKDYASKDMSYDIYERLCPSDDYSGSGSGSDDVTVTETET